MTESSPGFSAFCWLCTSSLRQCPSLSVLCTLACQGFVRPGDWNRSVAAFPRRGCWALSALMSMELMPAGAIHTWFCFMPGVQRAPNTDICQFAPPCKRCFEQQDAAGTGDFMDMDAPNWTVLRSHGECGLTQMSCLMPFLTSCCAWHRQDSSFPWVAAHLLWPSSSAQVPDTSITGFPCCRKGLSQQQHVPAACTSSCKQQGVVNICTVFCATVWISQHDYSNRPCRPQQLELWKQGLCQ